MAGAPPAYPSQVIRGARQRLAQGRMNLADALVCTGRLLNLWQAPGWSSLRGFASILRG